MASSTTTDAAATGEGVASADQTAVDLFQALEEAQALLRQGHAGRVLELATALSDQVEAQHDLHLKGEHQRVLCWAHQYVGDMKESVRACYRGVDFFTEARDQDGVARTLSLGASAMVRIGNASEALEMISRACDISTGLLPATQLRIWVNLSVVHAEMEEFDKAVEAAETAILFGKASDDPDGLRRAETNLHEFRVIRALRRHRDGAPHVSDELVAELDAVADHLARCLDDPHMASGMHALLGEGNLTLGRLDVALDHLRTATTVADEAGLHTDRARMLVTLSEAEHQAGLREDGLAHLRIALDLAQESGDDGRLATCHLRLSEAHEQDGDLASALAHYRTYHETLVAHLRERAATRAQVLTVTLDNERSRLEAELLRLRTAELERDKLDLQSRAEQLDRHANEDPLTGLGNRRYFERRMSQVFQDGGPTRPVTVGIADIDHFKHVNDTFSHAVGDLVLQQVGAILKDQFRPHDVVARFGGEEFVLALVGATAEQAARAAERLRGRIQAFDWATVQPGLLLTVSIGLAACEGLVDVDEALSRADTALYEAKDGGRNLVRVAVD